jgi:hypothetical protein
VSQIALRAGEHTSDPRVLRACHALTDLARETISVFDAVVCAIVAGEPVDAPLEAARKEVWFGVGEVGRCGNGQRCYQEERGDIFHAVMLLWVFGLFFVFRFGWV